MVDQGESVSMVYKDLLSTFNSRIDFEDIKNILVIRDGILNIQKDHNDRTFVDITSNSTVSTIEPNTSITYFVMRGKDTECMSVTYYTWIVTGSPDTDGSEYAGPKCGLDPLADIVVLFKYTQ